jgi:hypothetical protein
MEHSTHGGTSNVPSPPVLMRGLTSGQACHMDLSHASEPLRRPHSRWVRSAHFSLRGFRHCTRVGTGQRSDARVELTATI